MVSPEYPDEKRAEPKYPEPQTSEDGTAETTEASPSGLRTRDSAFEFDRQTEQNLNLIQRELALLSQEEAIVFASNLSSFILREIKRGNKIFVENSVGNKFTLRIELTK